MSSKTQNLCNNNSYFYIHNSKTGDVEWLCKGESFFGVDYSKINNKDDYTKIVSQKDRKQYRFNLSNNADEINCEYSVNCNGEKIFLKEFALKVTENEVDYFYGIITLNDEKDASLSSKEGKHYISSGSMLGGKMNSRFLNTLGQLYQEGKKNRNNYILMLISIDNLPMVINWQNKASAENLLNNLKTRIQDLIPNDSYLDLIADDQIALIMKNPTSNEIDEIVNKISNMVSLYKGSDVDEAIHLRLSIGSSHFPLGMKDEFDTLNKSFLALNNVKSKDYEFYCDYEDAKRQHIDSQNELAQLHYLQSAFTEKRLLFAYQPIVCADTGLPGSYECLLRIDEGGGKFDSAGRFIPIAEKMGTINEIDEFVLRQVIEELKTTPDTRLSINVSNLTTGNDQWLKMCSSVLTDEEIAKRITIEITETAAQRDLRKTAYFAATVQSFGCKVALDDFGVGYTSFRQLRSISVDTVKIDGSYILGLEENKENLIFIRSLIDFNKSYGLKTVAECVENGEVAKKLIDIGIDYLQGYYFGAPITVKPWEKELKKA